MWATAAVTASWQYDNAGNVTQQIDFEGFHHPVDLRRRQLVTHADRRPGHDAGRLRDLGLR